MATTCEVWIVSWTGQHDSAARIESELRAAGADVHVIWSDRSEQVERNAPSWLQVPNAHFLGAKFDTILRRIDADVMLMITADARHRDWAEIYAKCMAEFARHPKLGVWSPAIDFSPWNLGLVDLGTVPGTRLHKVVQTDSIVWALSRPVLDRLRALDLSDNNLGWGIDTIACTYCHASGLLAAIDPDVHVTHPRGTAYDTDLADSQFKTFLKQLTADEQRVLKDVQSRLRPDRAQARPGRNDPCPCGSGRKYKQCCGRS